LNLIDLVLSLEPDAPGADKVCRALPRILLVPELAVFDDHSGAAVMVWELMVLVMRCLQARSRTRGT